MLTYWAVVVNGLKWKAGRERKEENITRSRDKTRGGKRERERERERERGRKRETM